MLIERTRERAILAGDNSTQLRLTLLQSLQGVQRGDRIITSGHGGSFPVGIPVGEVVQTESGSVKVRPFADKSWLERDRFLRADRLIDTNSMELAVYGNEAEGNVLAVASLDNLGKGASGAAVQTINLKTGVDEATGLSVA